MPPSNRVNLFLSVAILLSVCLLGYNTSNADGPLRRLFRGQASHTPQQSSYVCENGACLPAASYVISSPVVTSPVVYSQPVQTRTAAILPVSAATEELSTVEADGGKFHRAVIQAAIAARKAGTINRPQLMRLRVAMLSPAFRAQAEDLALIQVVSSGEDLPFDLAEDGSIIRASINWEGLASFLERLVPIILMLLKAFGI